MTDLLIYDLKLLDGGRCKALLEGWDFDEAAGKIRVTLKGEDSPQTFHVLNTPDNMLNQSMGLDAEP